MRNRNLLLLNIKSILLILFLFLQVQESYAQYSIQEVWPSVANPNAISVGGVFEKRDGEINLTNQHHWDDPNGNSCLVSLKIDDTVALYSWVKTNITLKVTPIKLDGTFDTPYDINLTIESNFNSIAPNFIDLSTHQILNRNGVKVEVVKIEETDYSQANPIVDNPVSQAKPNVQLELLFSANRSYYLTNDAPTDLNASTITDAGRDVALKLNWQSKLGAKEYELEWTWVDRFGETSDLTANLIPFTERDFELNNTRIRTSNTTYEIPLIYQKGFLLYRLRAVGKINNDRYNSKATKYSDWTTGNGPKNKVSDWQYISIISHDDSKNWQLQTSFAENGKKKEVVSYFDGSLRNRQTVTKTNTDNTAIVGEVIYDYQGRPAIEVLPVPLLNNQHIRYYSNLTLNNDNKIFTYKDFDLDPASSSSICTPILTPSLRNTSGASQYYSEQNIGLGSNPLLKYLPNAEGYPFSQTIYTNDNTGRIMSKGGVGITHQIGKLDLNGKSHEMQYVYTVPEQVELNRLFGYSVGDASHYKKNIVVDPNNQISISYIDPKGKTIATALTGAAPYGMDTLAGNESGIVTDLLNKITSEDKDSVQDNNILGSTNRFGLLNDKLEVTKQLGVAGNIPYKFIYSVSNSTSFSPPTSSFLGSSCILDKYSFVYDFKFNLKDNCGFDKINVEINDSGPIGTKHWSASGSALSETNVTINSGSAINLTTGSYSLQKELKVNEKTLNEYVEHYIKQITDSASPCYINPDNFIPKIIKDLDCNTNCTALIAEIGYHPELYVRKGLREYYNISNDLILLTTASFNSPQNDLIATDVITDSILNTLTDDSDDFILEGEALILAKRLTAEWKILYKFYEDICNPKFNYFPIEECKEYNTILLKDMSPNGQYGKFEVKNDELDANNCTKVITDDKLSVFNENNQLYYNGTITNHNWRNPNPAYHDEVGNPSTIKVLVEQITSANQVIKTIPELKNYSSVIPQTDNVTGEKYVNALPQDLLCLYDFLNVWEESWAESLVIYHPENNYALFDKEVCKVTRSLPFFKITSINGVDTVTIEDSYEFKDFNSTNYDKYLDYLNYEAANILFDTADCQGNTLYNIRFFDINTTNFTSLNILNLDPFFCSQNTTVPSSILNTAKGLMTQALSTNYDGNGFNMLKMAYRNVVGYQFNPNSANPYNFTTLTAQQKAELWSFYKNYYKSLKSRVVSVLQNGYAFRKGGYNSCVGVANTHDYVSALSKYTTQAITLRTLFTSTFSTTLCNSNVDYSKKEKRYPAINAIYNSSIPGQDLISQGQSNADYQYYAQTGNCPMVRDLELFLKFYFEKDFTNFNNEKETGNYVTANLFKQLTTVSPWDVISPKTKIEREPNSPLVKFSFTGNGVNLCNERINLTLPVTSGLSWENYTKNPVAVGQWEIKDIYRLFYVQETPFTPGKYSYKVAALIKKAGGVIEEVILTGSTCLKIGECTLNSTNPNPNGDNLDSSNASIYDSHGCSEKAQFLTAFTVFFNKVKDLSTNSTLLADVPEYSQSFLATYFGEGPVVNSTWEYDVNRSEYRLSKAGVPVFVINKPSIDLTSSTVNSISYDNITRTFKLYVTNNSNGSNSVLTTNVKSIIEFDCCIPNPSGCPGDPDCDGIIGNDPCFGTNNTCLNQAVCSNSNFEINYETKLKDALNWILDINNRRQIRTLNGLISSTTPINNLYFGVGLNNLYRRYDALAYNIRDLNDHYSLQATYDLNDFTVLPNNGVLNIKFKKRIVFYHNGRYDNDHHYEERWQNLQVNINIDNISSIGNIDIVYRPNLVTSSEPSPYRLHIIYVDKATGQSVSTFASFSHILEPFSVSYHAGSTWWSHTYGVLRGANISNYCSFSNSNALNRSELELSSDLSQNFSNLDDTSTNEHCQSCIPQPIETISGTAMYNDYLNYFNFTNTTIDEVVFKMSTTGVLNVTQDYTEKEFINLNLGYNWLAYKKYLTTLGITSTIDSRYISIIEFGQTYLKYGYKYMADDFVQDGQPTIESAVDQYVIEYNRVHALNTDGNTSNDEQLKGWIQFINEEYEIPLNLCPPNPLPTNTTQFILPVPTPDCQKIKDNLAGFYGQELYLAYIESLKEEFKQRYIKEAMGNAVEKFDMDFKDNEYQYTLYYYDQAGNLTQTVAPEGINKIAQTFNNAINKYRNDNITIDNLELQPTNSFKTQYKYNSLNQLVWQSTPDGGVTRFAYDKLGRIIASQNANQDNEIVHSGLVYLGNNLIKDAATIMNQTDSGWKVQNFGYYDTTINGGGYIERTVGRINSENDLTMLGFTHDPTNANLTISNSTLDDVEKCQLYAFYITTDNNLLIKYRDESFENRYENAGRVQFGDKLKVERINNYYNYYLNNTLITSKKDVYPLNNVTYASFFIYQKNSKLFNVRVVNYDEEKRFSYTKYDELGRIKEAGQVHTISSQNYSISDEGKLIKDNSAVDSFESNNPCTEVTKTIYDQDPFVEPNKLASSLFVTNQGVNTATATLNNRNRVTGIYYYDAYQDDTTFDNAIFYNYDVHGNVKELVTYYTPIKETNCTATIITNANGEVVPNDCELHLKRTVYDYDLISGNVNKVTFQPKKADQFIHKYEYDADNRIVNVQTSRNGLHWEKDANYNYYPHGPLARVELGNKKVQGLDYTYTLQGWLKGVNGENLVSPENTMNHDGASTSSTRTNDAFGYSLSYYDNDYKSIDPSATTKPLMFSKNNDVAPSTYNLYNGNIKQMTTSIRKSTHELLDVQKNNYKYDQLNRITGMTSSAIKPNENGFTQARQSISSAYSYDKNGNLKTLSRYGLNESGEPVLMDDLKYDYVNGDNKLRLVSDTAGNSDAFTNDLENQVTQLADLGYTYDISDMASHNYVYDEIGQLIEDKSERLKIEWRVDGKVKNVIKNDFTSTLFEYDGLGNRIAKSSYTASSGFINSTSKSIYARDAQGNVLSVYNYSTSFNYRTGISNRSLSQNERHLYGSSRLGVEEDGLTVFKATSGGLLAEARTLTSASSVVTPEIDYALRFNSGTNPTKVTWDNVNLLSNPEIDHFKFNTKVKLLQPIPDTVDLELESDYTIGQFSYKGNYTEGIDTQEITFLGHKVDVNSSQFALIQTDMLPVGQQFIIDNADTSISASLPCMSAARIGDNGSGEDFCEATSGTAIINSVLENDQKGYLSFSFGTPLEMAVLNGGNRFKKAEIGLLIDNTKYSIYAEKVPNTLNTYNYAIKVNGNIQDFPRPFNITHNEFKIERVADKINFYDTLGQLVKTISVASVSQPTADLIINLYDSFSAVNNVEVFKYSPTTQNAEVTNQVVVSLSQFGDIYKPKVTLNQFKKVNALTTLKQAEVYFNGTGLTQNQIMNDGVVIDFDLKLNDLANSFFTVTTNNPVISHIANHNFGSSSVMQLQTIQNNLQTPIVLNQLGGQTNTSVPLALDMCYFGYELSNDEGTENHYFTFDSATTPLTDVNGLAPITVTPTLYKLLGPCMLDSDGDGIYDAFEDVDGDNNLATGDTDGDNSPNYLDSDDDGDGILTINEDSDANGNHNPDDAVNTDGDQFPDYLDVDDDNDGIPTWHTDEGGPGQVNSIIDPNGGRPFNGLTYNVDSNNDGLANYLDTSNGQVIELSLIKNNFVSLVGDKRYELSNHLGNVLSVISDRKIYNSEASSIVHFTNFTSTVTPWEKSANAHSIIVESGRLKVMTGKDLNGANGYYTLEQGKTYNIGIDVDTSTFTAPLEFSVWKGNDKLQGQMIASGMVNTTFTPAVTGTYRLNFRLRQNNYIGAVQTFFIDNVKIYDATPTNGTLALGVFNPEVISYSDYYPFGSLVPNRTSNSTEYRYGFNGKEKDDELKGEGNSYDFGARLLDPRIGRWFKSDPLERKYPNLSTYAYSANNPMYYIDPDGEEPIPVTSREFIKFANKLGIYGNKRVGEFYERLVMGSLASDIEIVHNTSMNFPSDVRAKMNAGSGGLPASVRPDGVKLTQYGAFIPVSLEPLKVENAEQYMSPHFYEAKATSATITKKYRKGQITGMIDAVADLKKKRNERGVLTLITTSDTKISKDIKEYAAQRGVHLLQSVAAIDDETGEFTISNPKLINNDQINNAGKNPGDGAGWLFTKIFEIFIDDDPYSTHDKVNPKNYTKGLPKSSETSDPDPAQVNN